MHKPTHLRSNLLSAASAILVEASKIVVPQRVLDHAKKEGFPQKDAETIYRLWIDRISIAEIMKKISAEAKAAKAPNEAVEVDESAKEMIDPIKNSKGLHNSPKPLGQASIKELEASKAWYQETIEKHKETTPSFSVRLKQLLALVNTELASRIGKKKNEEVELDEGIVDFKGASREEIADIIKKLKAAGHSPEWEDTTRLSTKNSSTQAALKKELKIFMSYKNESTELDEAVAKIACVDCDAVSTAAAWKKNRGFCPVCKVSNKGVAESVELDEDEQARIKLHGSPEAQSKYSSMSKADFFKMKPSAVNSIIQQYGPGSKHDKENPSTAKKIYTAAYAARMDQIKAHKAAKTESIEEVVKPHGARLMPPKDTSSHTPNVTKAMNFVKGFNAAEMESFLLELAEYFMYSHDDMSNAQGVGSFLKKAYTEWKSRK